MVNRFIPRHPIHYPVNNSRSLPQLAATLAVMKSSVIPKLISSYPRCKCLSFLGLYDTMTKQLNNRLWTSVEDTGCIVFNSLVHLPAVIYRSYTTMMAQLLVHPTSIFKCIELNKTGTLSPPLTGIICLPGGQAASCPLHPIHIEIYSNTTESFRRKDCWKRSAGPTEWAEKNSQASEDGWVTVPSVPAIQHSITTETSSETGNAECPQPEGGKL
ncbi:uncharacterized protein LOC107751984 isoform X1 [Sinocyclocheilus rhinocerous]|uniref:uncharacterized protein LOC107751984 isoform X1 n=3 Tax=Sinocyclocheilus rhinocerous TaxID=307959 RepID=UPI0007B95E9B|nr:PREDICTED: uncharacterized protein LOC107751984 isoform X1 [Sinocyclocheilus rhinocerous]